LARIIDYHASFVLLTLGLRITCYAFYYAFYYGQNKTR